jgi:putative transposase
VKHGNPATAVSQIFNYIEFYYNPERRHGNNDGVSPVVFEEMYYEKLSAV